MTQKTLFFLYYEMRRFFHATFITRLLQLPELPCSDFQGLKKNNVHDIVI